MEDPANRFDGLEELGRLYYDHFICLCECFYLLAVSLIRVDYLCSQNEQGSYSYPVQLPF